MEPNADVPPTEVTDFTPDGMRMDQRKELVAFAVQLFGEGKTASEIESAVVLYMSSKNWVSGVRLAPFWIVKAAKYHWSKAAAAKVAAKAAAVQKKTEAPRELKVVSLADVRPEPVRWLWPGKIPLGKVTVVCGAAGLGKTSWSLDLAARVSSGQIWPDNSQGPGAGKVVILNGEDGLQDTILLRLVGGAANMQNVTIISGTTPVPQDGVPAESSRERRFELARDIPVLRQRIETLGDVRLLVIDSLQAFCGGAGQQSHKLRMQMAELSKLADDYGVAVVVISAGNKCELPVKTLWRLDCDRLEPNLKWWVPVRSGCGPLPPAHAFRIQKEVIVWEDRSYVYSPDQSVGSSAQEVRNYRLQAITSWLKIILAVKPRPAREVFQMGKGQGWSASQLKEAKELLKIMSFKEGEPRGKWFWALPHRTPLPPVMCSVAEGGLWDGEAPAERGGLLLLRLPPIEMSNNDELGARLLNSEEQQIRRGQAFKGFKELWAEVEVEFRRAGATTPEEKAAIYEKLQRREQKLAQRARESAGVEPNQPVSPAREGGVSA